ncbi:ribonuclease BN [Clostridium tepidiprofundi DSM 19306]|uniref:Ribonuclease BN n=1 Tax=Clostridium tepidiprofundi DSM 19306 TaxID=1121338 RepID=A0A151B495_9CLOT|nr:MBL fold metallo-hydrolase [Clostridium tepidiprofundi]KYH34623.1 ribonuclease BN [Clostridium tepidiprofundi DSM 19306]
MMKVTIIGCCGAYPDANKATSGYLVETDNTKLLLDCGSGVLSLLQNYISIEELDAVILSHYHGDHTADVQSLQYAVEILSRTGNREKILNIFGINQQPYFNKLSYGEYCKAYQINNNSIVKVGDLSISFSGNVHSMPCLSMKITYKDKSFVYSGDTEWTDNLIELSRGCEFIICESNLYNNQLGKVPGHLTAGEAGKIAAQSGVKKLILTHLPHYGNHNQLINEAKAEFDGIVELASSGKIISI